MSHGYDPPVVNSVRHGFARRCLGLAASALPLIGAVVVTQFASAEGSGSLTPQIRIVMDTDATVHTVLVEGLNENRLPELTSLDYRGNNTWERASWRWSYRSCLRVTVIMTDGRGAHDEVRWVWVPHPSGEWLDKHWSQMAVDPEEGCRDDYTGRVVLW